MKGIVGEDYTMETLTIAGARDRKKENYSFLSLIEEEYTLKDVKKILFTRDRYYCIQVKREQKTIHLTLQDFQNQSSAEDYQLLYDAIQNKSMKQENSMAYLDTLLMKNNDNKQNKEKKKKMFYENKKDRYYNESNCMLFALRSLVNGFKLKDYVNDFRFLGLKDQIDAANIDLKKGGYELQLKTQCNHVLKTYLAEVKSPSLLFFYYRNQDLHTEAVNNCSFLAKLQKNIEEIINEEVHIIHYELNEVSKNDEINEEEEIQKLEENLI